MHFCFWRLIDEQIYRDSAQNTESTRITQENNSKPSATLKWIQIVRQTYLTGEEHFVILNALFRHNLNLNLCFSSWLIPGLRAEKQQ